MNIPFIRVMVIALVMMLHWNCRPHTDVLDSKLSSLFFEADLNNNYHQLVTYYNEQKVLKQIEPAGWTMYPPLSAFGQSGKKQTSSNFEFHQYQDMPGLKQGFLTLRKVGEEQDADAVTEMSLTFNSAKDAEAAFSTILKKFADFQKTEGPFSPGMKSTIVNNRRDKPVVHIALFNENDHYAVYIYPFTGM